MENKSYFLNNESEEPARRLADKLGFKLRSFNECCRDGESAANPRDLFNGLWFEGELSALYADTNLGKSILAVQIGEQLAKEGIRTLYVDLELSDKGIELRSRDSETGALHSFPELFHRLTMNYNDYLDANPGADENGFDIINCIEAIGQQLGVQALILDNITAICAGVESGDVAVGLVKRLLSLRDDNNWSVLFIAHTPKLERGTPITRDSMAGSKRVISLIDSAFAIGDVLSHPGLRYIKQTKVRMADTRFHEGNVLVCRIDREDGLLKFIPVDTAVEQHLLRAPKNDVFEKRHSEVSNLSREGYSVKEIAELTDLSASQVYRILAKNKTEA